MYINYCVLIVYINQKYMELKLKQNFFVEMLYHKRELFNYLLDLITFFLIGLVYLFQPLCINGNLYFYNNIHEVHLVVHSDHFQQVQNYDYYLFPETLTTNDL